VIEKYGIRGVWVIVAMALVTVLAWGIVQYLSAMKNADPASLPLEIQTKDGGPRVSQNQERSLVPSAFRIQTKDGGRWASRNQNLRPEELSDDQKTMIRQLEAIGYVTGVNKADSVGGAIIRDREKCYSGFGVYLSGHGPEAILIDLEGTTLHRWRLPSKDLWNQKRDIPQYFRKAHVWPNGDLLVIIEGVGLVKIDKDSRIIWKKENRAHHDFDIVANGDIFVLTRRAHIVSEVNESTPILEDFVVGLKSDGTQFMQKSVLRIILGSEYAELVGQADPRLPPRFEDAVKRGDILHTNTLEIVRMNSEEVPWLKKGTIITSSPYLCSLMALDIGEEKLSWFFKKDFTGQHEPELLENGNILFFDNHNHTKQSTVIEFDPKTGETMWEYDGAPDRKFFSQGCSTAYRLPNGNTQITITDMGKVIEVTPEKEVVWEFFNPHRTGERNELVASIFDMVRISPDFPIEWAKNSTLSVD
jgi:hypothetical protein